jgi:4-hydroxyphenylacetate 3-monooxygenase
MDKVLIPWENVLIYRDFDRCRRWTMEGGPHVPAAGLRAPGGETRLYHRPAEEIAGMYRHPEFRGVQADLGEVVAWRNMFWALSDSMCSEATRGSTARICRITPRCKPTA